MTDTPEMAPPGGALRPDIGKMTMGVPEVLWNGRRCHEMPRAERSDPIVFKRREAAGTACSFSPRRTWENIPV